MASRFPQPSGHSVLIAGLPPPLAASSAVLVGANLLPLFAVAVGWWSTAEVMLLFWAENVAIGMAHLARFGALALLRRQAEAIGLGLFFALHYGLFTFVHGVFVVSFFGGAAADPEAGVLAALLSADGVLFGFLALVASHLFSFAVNFLWGGEYRQAKAEALMHQPYQRVVVLHLVVLFGGFATLALGEAGVALLLLVLLKISVDLRAHLAEHRRAAAAAVR